MGVSPRFFGKLAGAARAASLRAILFEGPCAPRGLEATLRATGLVLARFEEASPRHADLLVVAGRVSLRMLPVVQRVWQQMPEPKWCLAVEAGTAIDSYALIPQPGRFLPIDAAVGASDEAILRGVEQIRRLARGEAPA